MSHVGVEEKSVKELKHSGDRPAGERRLRYYTEVKVLL